MSKYIQYVFYALAVVIILVGALYEGTRTSRWSDPQDPILDSFAAGIHDIPVDLGYWTGDTRTERREMEALIAEEAGAVATLTRSYMATSMEKGVTVNIICGLSRKVAIHTPDACYRGSGYVMEGEIETVRIPYLDAALLKKLQQSDKEVDSSQATKEATFYTAVFVHEGQDGYIDRQRVFWAWKGYETDWLAPSIPRNRWSPTDPLCKLYLSTVEKPGDELNENPVYDFGKVLFPVLDKLLDGHYQIPASNFEETKDVLEEDSSTPAVAEDAKSVESEESSEVNTEENPTEEVALPNLE